MPPPRPAVEKADEAAFQHWKVEDGEIVYDGKNNSLCTTKDYADFEMLVDWKIEKDGDGQKAKEAWVNKDLIINLATPVVVGQHLYSHGPAQNFVCIDSRTGKEMWRHDGFGKEYSSTIALGKNLLVLTDMGELVLVAADSSQYKELARRQVCGKTWSFPAYIDGKLYVRDGRELICLDLNHPD